MAIRFSQAKSYRDLTIQDITNLSAAEAHEKCIVARWGGRETVTCPECGFIHKHYFNRARRTWRCRACHASFSVTSGTIFANRRLPFQTILLIMYRFVASPKSVAAHQGHAELGMTQRTLYLSLGKIREALWQQRETGQLQGIVHIDGGHFCGKPRRPRVRKGITSAIVNSRLRNRKAGIIPPKKGVTIEPWNLDKLKNRRVVIVMREVSPIPKRGAIRTRVIVVKAETAANVLTAIHANVSEGATIMTDESPAYSRLGAWYDHQAVKHAAEYCRDDGVNQNQAESFIARLRRMEYGTLHGMRAPYFGLYANEAAWREDTRWNSLGEKFNILLCMVFKSRWSKAWRGYNQGHRLSQEFDGLQ